MSIINRESLLTLFDSIPTINGLGLEPLIALRDVKEIIKAVPEVDAVPLDKLCEMFSYHHVNVPCDSDCENCIAFDGTGNTVNCWKLIISQWMEAQNAR